MKKVIIFSVPSDTVDSTLIPKLDELMSELGVHSHVIVLTEKDLACNARQIHPAIVILKDIIKTCGTGKNRINFNVNFYQALANGFYASTKDVKIILNEIIEGRNIPEVIAFAKANDIPFIFNLAEEALGMMRLIMGKTYKETSWKSKDFEKNRAMRKKPKHRKMEAYNRKKVQTC